MVRPQNCSKRGCRATHTNGADGRLDGWASETRQEGVAPGWALCPGKKGVSFEFAVRCGTGQVSRGGWVH